MMNRFTICFCFLLIVNLPNAQSQIKRVEGSSVMNTRQISGSVRDTTGEGMVPYAHVSFVCGKDTTRMVADTYGNFVYKGLIEDSMQILVTAIGYKPFVGNFSLQEHGFDVKILMQQDIVALNEVIIQGNHIAMVIKGDTLQYNAEAFTTLEGDFMDVLLKKIPGVEFDGVGLTVNGERIAKIYVNGSDALFGSVTADQVVKNIEADNVKNIKVYDEWKKEDQKLGLKYGERQTVMDVTTRKKVDAIKNSTLLLGGGRGMTDKATVLSKEKYNVDFKYNRFIPGKSINLTGILSNIGPTMSGEQKMYGGTFKYNGSWKDNSLTYSTSNVYNNETHYVSRENRRNYFATETYESRHELFSEYHKRREYYYRTENHFMGNLDWGNIRLGGIYEFRGKQIYQENNTLSMLDGDQLGKTHVLDNQKGHQQYVKTYIEYLNTLPGKILLNVTGIYDWSEDKGSGWRIDTLQESSVQLFLDKDINHQKKSWSGRLNLGKALTPLWRLIIEGNYAYQEETSKGVVTDVFTHTIDTTNTRDYSLIYRTGEGHVLLNYYTQKTSFQFSLDLKHITREHTEYFPVLNKFEEHFLFWNPLIRWKKKFSPVSNMELEYKMSQIIPTIEQTRGVIDDLNPLALQAGNPNIKIPKEHTANVVFNQTFVEQSSSLGINVNYVLTQDYITTNSQYFTESKYLLEYNYTVLAGATLYSTENSDSYHRLIANVNYSKLSKWLKSSVKMSLGYDYQKRPSFYQGEVNHGESHQGSFVFHITSNFSKKIELSFKSTTGLTNYKSAWSNASNMLKEAINFSVRTTFIPQYTLLAKMNYKYNKQYSTGEEVDNTLLEASISRKIGKQAHLSLTGYNLLDTSDSKFLSKTAEYVAYSQTSQIGRYLLLSLKFNF